MRQNNKNIFFFGANSDLCFELIKVYLKREKNLNLFFFSRDLTRLKKLKNYDFIKYFFICIDLSKREKVFEILNKLEFSPDIIYFFNSSLDKYFILNQKIQSINNLFHTNFLSIVDICNYYIKKKINSNQNFQIACISSIAGERGKANNILYSASKASLTCYLSSIRQKFSNNGIQVLTVLPGYINTKMVSNLRLTKILTDDPKKLSYNIYNAVKKKKDIYIPLKWRFINLIVKLIPEEIFKKIKFFEK